MKSDSDLVAEYALFKYDLSILKRPMTGPPLKMKLHKVLSEKYYKECREILVLEIVVKKGPSSK